MEIRPLVFVLAATVSLMGAALLVFRSQRIPQSPSCSLVARTGLNDYSFPNLGLCPKRFRIIAVKVSNLFLRSK